MNAFLKKCIGLIDSLNQSFWLRVTAASYVNKDSLGIFRWIYGLYFFLVKTHAYYWVGHMPDAFFKPSLFSFGWLFSGFPAPIFFDVLDITILISVFLMTVGYKARLFTILVILQMIIGQTFAYSMAKIDHSFMEIAMLFCMVLAGWGSKHALVPDKPLKFESTIKGLSLLAVLIAFGYFSAGILKLIVWVDFDLSTSGFLTWYYYGAFTKEDVWFLAPIMGGLPLIIHELMDYSAVFIEISGFVFLLWNRKAWLIWLMIISFFHLGTTMTLNIPFAEHLVLFLPFVAFSSYSKLAKNINPAYLASLFFILLIIHVILRVFFTAGETLFISRDGRMLTVRLFTGFVLWIGVLVLLTFELRREYKKV